MLHIGKRKAGQVKNVPGNNYEKTSDFGRYNQKYLWKIKIKDTIRAAI